MGWGSTDEPDPIRCSRRHHAARPERHAVYTFRACWADRWRRGRILLAGDAAHLMPPFAGQGMCSGMRDAANLAWKLDLILAHGAPEELLDSYESERSPHAKQTIEFSVALGRVIRTADPAEAAERDARMIPAARAAGFMTPPASPKLGPGLWIADDPTAGALFLQAHVSQAGRTARLDELTGGGRLALVSNLADPARFLTPAQLAWLRSLETVFAYVAPGAAIDDDRGAYGRWFAEHGCAVVLQRPDFVVFGTAKDLAGTGALVEAFRDRLTG